MQLCSQVLLVICQASLGGGDSRNPCLSVNPGHVYPGSLWKRGPGNQLHTLARSISSDPAILFGVQRCFLRLFSNHSTLLIPSCLRVSSALEAIQTILGGWRVASNFESHTVLLSKTLKGGAHYPPLPCKHLRKQGSRHFPSSSSICSLHPIVNQG